MFRVVFCSSLRKQALSFLQKSIGWNWTEISQYFNFFSSQMINNHPIKPLSNGKNDNLRTSSAIFPSSIQGKPLPDQLKYGKPTYSSIPQNPPHHAHNPIFTHRARPDELRRTESFVDKKKDSSSLVQDPLNRTPVKKYAMNKDSSLNGSLVRQQPKMTFKERPEKFSGSFYNGERQTQFLSMTPTQTFPKQIPTDRGYHTFPKPFDIQERSPITRPMHHGKDGVMLENQQHYFEYILEYSYRSKKGMSIVDKDKVNQDSYIAAPNLNKQTWLHYFGVCDGHGENGQLVSQYIKKNLPKALQQIKNINDNPKQQFTNVFKSISDRLPGDLNVDLGMSGSTSAGVYLSHNRLFCLNLGDSKAVLGSKEKQSRWRATALSIDHKPQNPHEAARIVRSNGRIDSYRDQNGKQVGPMRVWLKNEDTPGLAMTRCFGDQVAAKVGVISIPQVREFILSEKDKIIIVASDGIWQFLSEQQVIEIVAPFYEKRNIQGACNVLLDTAIKLWKEDNSEAIDDITFVLLFLDYDMGK